MTQENKQLLLTDLCGRLPYGVKVQESTLKYDGTWKYRDIDLTIDNINCIIINFIKPYLFPLSSMTEEQEKEYEDALVYHDYVKGGWTIAKTFNDEYIIPYWFVDFCNKNHFDFRNLIGRGLAIDCTNLNIY